MLKEKRLDVLLGLNILYVLNANYNYIFFTNIESPI